MATNTPHHEGFNGSVAREISAELGRRHMTAAALAEKIGMHPTQVSRYLNCVRAMDLRTVDQFARGLGMDAVTLVSNAVERDEQQ